MKITLLGTGTSQGVPVIACDCPVCSSTDPRDKRLRCAIQIELLGKVLVVDTGPDFRQQMLNARTKQLDGVLMTHLHKDHVAGMDDVRAFNFRQKKSIDVYADERTRARLVEEFPYVFDGTNYPGVPRVQLHDIDENDEQFVVEGIPITPIPVMHHKLPVLGFRIGNFAYVTDANYIPPESMKRLQGLDVLVLDALRHEPHISHFSLEEAVGKVKELQPRQAYFTHISHLMGRHADINPTLPEGIALSYDGLAFEVADPTPSY